MVVGISKEVSDCISKSQVNILFINQTFRFQFDPLLKSLTHQLLKQVGGSPAC